jgi:penicillin amidase
MTRIFKKLGLILILLLAALIAVSVCAFFWYQGATQPQVEGRVKLAGLSAPVDIVRDAQGVPHIYARSADDAYFALGFVHAQDRLWQLELNRRIAAGRMAELFGAKAVDTDRFLRTLGVRRNAERIVPNLSADARAALESYSKGINAFLAQRTGPLPPEFLLTGAPAPEPWQPADSLGWQTMMAWDLSGNWTQELLRMRLAQRLSLQQINEFLPPYPGEEPVKTQDYTKLYRELGSTTQQLSKVAAIAPPSLIDGMGSNNWVVSGALSETGKPLVANDPHLSMSAPSLWYLAHLSAPGLNVIGGTLPGLPMVVLGRNDRVAWGFTNTAPDVQDLFIERINPADDRQYQTPEGWAAFKTTTETIKVKGQPDVKLEVRESRHGPVITGALPVLAKAAVNPKKYVVAFSWTALRADDSTLQAGIRLNRAGNWQEFLDAAKDFSAPQQNVIYADVDGNIGFIAPARVPIRKAENDLKGLAPAPGWDARYDWGGFIPFDQLPRQYNPASQRVVTANDKIVGPEYPHFLTSEWTPPYRGDRIRQLLDARPKHSMNSFAEIQKDHVSLAAQELLPIVRNTVPRTDRAKAALDTLARWNGDMDANLSQPLIFNAWMREASRRIFADELGMALMNDYWEQRNVHQPMVNVLKDKDGQGRWCSDIARSSTVKPQTCDDVLSASLDTALADLENRYGTKMSEWRWGNAHVARSEHRPFSKVEPLARLFDIRMPASGDTYTVNAGRLSLRDEKDPFATRHAAGFRALYDLSDLENSRFIQATGQSGNALSPLYRNYAQRWADVAYVPMKTQRPEVEKGSLGILTLSP